MIPYHGTPIGGDATTAARFLRGRHAMVSYAHQQHMTIAAEVCQSFALDNGAFSLWKRGERAPDWSGYYTWVDQWRRHPGFDWAVIPDVIDGDAHQNDELVAAWPFPEHVGVPVWHLQEDLVRLAPLVEAFPRVALGSSGAYAKTRNHEWWNRMYEAMAVICDEQDRPKTKIHGLRMLDPAIFIRFPFSSADSTNVARNVTNPRWSGPYAPASSEVRALVLADRIETHNAPGHWEREPAAVQIGMWGDV